MKRQMWISGLLVLSSHLLFGDPGAEAPSYWSGSSDLATATCSAVLDCREVIPVMRLENEPALQGLMYSAIGWGLSPEADSSRKVTITAQSGSLKDGVFTPDGSPGITVLPETEGRGEFDWTMSEIPARIYRLTHTVRKGGVVDATAYLYGYFDFTHCRFLASQEIVEEAVLGEISHAIAVTQDEMWPWQPIDLSVARSGIVTDSELEQGVVTTTAFSFKGCGVLRCEYKLGGGTLEVRSDGVTVATFDEPAAWTACSVVFSEPGEHEVDFAYKAAGGGFTAGLRNVRWEESGAADWVRADFPNVRADFQKGEVRTPRKLAHVLPFVYSPTNFTGTVDGTSSRVSVVRLAGDDPDVTKWTEVLGTTRVLKESTDEGEVVWNAKKGVWKATFEIFDGETLKETQIKFFDLRNATGRGLALILK